jgi:general secretion pathway protein G
MYARVPKFVTPRERKGATLERGEQLGFTLIELLIVIAVLGILAAVVVFSLGGVTAKAAVAACQSDAKTTETAVAAYEAQDGGVAPTSLDALTQGADPYLQSVPSSSYYAISLVNGAVMVAAPPSATPVSATAPGACTGAGGPGAPSTVPPTSTTSTTTTIPPTTTTSTTTTIPPTTTTSTTTTTEPPSNGVAATTTSLNYNNYGGQERVSLTNASAITSLTITVSIVKSPGVTYNSESNSFPGGDITEGETTSGGVITYTFDLTPGRSIPAHTGGTIYAQFSGDGAVHSFAGDTWSVVSTSGNVKSTLSGSF